jgi:hypothetical protein
MRIQLVALAAALATIAIAAPSNDRLQSAGCVNAMSALHDVEDAVVTSAKSGKGTGAADSRVIAKLAELKRVAAQTCLGGDGSLTPLPQHIGQQPIAVAPVTVSPNASGARVPANTSPLLPPLSVAPLKSIASCDAAGCWASDGTRLQRVGPNLLGPKGFCTVQGSVLNCP